MDSRQLEYFCEVVRLGSFTRAAERCHISQSAVSQQVRALERDLGCDLLERRGRRFSPTAAGTLLAAKGSALLGKMADLEAEVYDVANGRPRSLSVGYLNRYDGWEVADAVATVAGRHPGVEVRAHGGTHDQLYHDALEGRADVIFNDRRRSLSDQWENLGLLASYRYVEVSGTNGLGSAAFATCEGLSSMACVLVCEPEQREVETAWWRDVMNFSGDFLFAADTGEARMAVAADRGWMPTESRERTGPGGGAIRHLPLHDGGGHARCEYYAFWPKGRENPLAAEFAQVLRGLFDGCDRPIG